MQKRDSTASFGMDDSLCVSMVCNEMASIYQAPVPATTKVAAVPAAAPRAPVTRVQAAAPPTWTAPTPGVAATPAPPQLLGSTGFDQEMLESKIIDVGDGSTYYGGDSAVKSSIATASMMAAPPQFSTPKAEPIIAAPQRKAWKPSTAIENSTFGPSGPSASNPRLPKPIPEAAPTASISESAAPRSILKSILVKKDKKNDETDSQSSSTIGRVRAGSQEAARNNWARHSSRISQGGNTLTQQNLTLLADTPSGQSTFGVQRPDSAEYKGKGDIIIDSPFPVYLANHAPKAVHQTQQKTAGGVVETACLELIENRSERPNGPTAHSRSASNAMNLQPDAPTVPGTPSKQKLAGGGDTPLARTPTGGGNRNNGWNANKKTPARMTRGVSEICASLEKQPTQQQQQSQLLERGHTPTADRMRKLQGLAQPVVQTNRYLTKSVRTTDSWRMGSTDSFVAYVKEAEAEQVARRPKPVSVAMASAGPTPAKSSAKKGSKKMRLPRDSEIASDSDSNEGASVASSKRSKKDKKKTKKRRSPSTESEQESEAQASSSEDEEEETPVQKRHKKGSNTKKTKSQTKRGDSKADHKKNQSTTSKKKKNLAAEESREVSVVNSLKGVKKIVAKNSSTNEEKKSVSRQKRDRDNEAAMYGGGGGGGGGSDGGDSYEDYQDFGGGEMEEDSVDADQRALDDLDLYLFNGSKQDDGLSGGGSSRGAANVFTALASTTTAGGRKKAAIPKKEAPGVKSKKITASRGTAAATTATSSDAAPPVSSRFGALLNPNTTSTTGKGRKATSTSAAATSSRPGGFGAPAAPSRQAKTARVVKQQFSTAACVPPALDITPRSDQSDPFGMTEIRSMDLDNTDVPALSRQRGGQDAGRGISKKPQKKLVKTFNR